MAKKKEKPQTVNHIRELNLEIDYDKLAEAMVKAQEQSEAKANEKKWFTSGAFSVLLTIAFYGLSVVGWIFVAAAGVSIGDMIQTFPSDNWIESTSRVLTIVFMFIFAGIIGAYSVYLWKSAGEIAREKDRNYIISLFSSVVSFAALIVALVALFKGVG